jgi:hypothetical protein
MRMRPGGLGSSNQYAFGIIFLVLVVFLMAVVAFTPVTLAGIDVAKENWWVIAPVIIVGAVMLWLMKIGKIKMITHVAVLLILGFVMMIFSNAIGSYVTEDADTRAAKKMAKEAGRNLTEEQKPIPCASKAGDTPKQITALNMEIYAVSGAVNELGQLIIDDKVDQKEFSIETLKTGAGDGGEGERDVVAIAKTGNDQPATFATWLQVCDAENRTTGRNELPVFEPGYILSTETMQYVTIKNIDAIPLSTGKHRIDGYIYFDNKWQLVTRLDDVNITE